MGAQEDISDDKAGELNKSEINCPCNSQLSSKWKGTGNKVDSKEEEISNPTTTSKNIRALEAKSKYDTRVKASKLQVHGSLALVLLPP